MGDIIKFPIVSIDHSPDDALREAIGKEFTDVIIIGGIGNDQIQIDAVVDSEELIQYRVKQLIDWLAELRD